MAIFSKYKKVIEADGSPMSVRTALSLINQELDEILSDVEERLDADSSFAVAWFETYQYSAGPFGQADNLTRARNVSVKGVQAAGILASAAGKVRLLTRAELPDDWDPQKDSRQTVWEATQHLIKRLQEAGEESAAILRKKLGPDAEQARKPNLPALYHLRAQKMGPGGPCLQQPGDRLARTGKTGRASFSAGRIPGAYALSINVEKET